MIRRRPNPKPDRSFAGASRDRGVGLAVAPPLARSFAGVRRTPPSVDGRFLLPASVSSDRLGGDVTEAGIDLLVSADAAAQRTALALGTAAVEAAATFEQAANRGAVSGYASLDSDSKVPAAQLGSGTPDGTKFLRDDRTWAATSVGSHTHAASDVTSGTIGTARLGSGTATSSSFLRGDQTWAAPTASVALNSTSVAFTDGDTVRRVTVTDASVGATDKVLVTIRRPDIADDSADAGHIYTANVVLVAAGSFDVVVACCDRGFGDTTERPPNETIQLVWTRAA